MRCLCILPGDGKKRPGAPRRWHTPQQRNLKCLAKARTPAKTGLRVTPAINEPPASLPRACPSHSQQDGLVAVRHSCALWLWCALRAQVTQLWPTHPCYVGLPGMQSTAHRTHRDLPVVSHSIQDPALTRAKSTGQGRSSLATAPATPAKRAARPQSASQPAVRQSCL